VPTSTGINCPHGPESAVFFKVRPSEKWRAVNESDSRRHKWECGVDKEIETALSVLEVDAETPTSGEVAGRILVSELVPCQGCSTETQCKLAHRSSRSVAKPCEALFNSLKRIDCCHSYSRALRQRPPRKQIPRWMQQR
jgi:hypothetical protein